MTGSNRHTTSQLRHIVARGHLWLVLCSVLLAALALTLTGAVLIRGYAQSNLDLVGRTVSYAVEPSIYFGDVESVDRALASVADMTDVQQLDVLDAGGRRIGHWQRADDKTAGPLIRLTNALFWPEPRRQPILHEGQPIGVVVIHGHAGGLLRYALIDLTIGISCLGLILLAMRLLARRLQNRIVRPLEDVARLSERVRESRDFSLRVGPADITEIDRLGQDFNALLAELEGWHRRIENENARLAHDAEHDPLTGLGNRARFERRLDEALAHAGQQDQQCSLLFIDSDRFKQINDVYGHEAGDAVLIEVAHRLRSTLRERDDVFRIGGDEFAAILEHEPGRPSSAWVIERIEDVMTWPVELPGREAIAISVSIGAATWPHDAGDAPSLLRAADAAMYVQKRERWIDAP